jgi:hypothetical protein
MISAVSWAISESMSISADSSSCAQRSQVSRAASTITGTNSGIREMCRVGATMRRRRRQVSPSLKIRPSPATGSSALRCPGLFRPKESLWVLKKNWTDLGVLHKKMSRPNSRIDRNS